MKYDVKIIERSGDRYRAEVTPVEDMAPVIAGIVVFVVAGLVLKLMDTFDLTFEQALNLFVTSLVSLAAIVAGLVIWLRPKFLRWLEG